MAALARGHATMSTAAHDVLLSRMMPTLSHKQPIVKKNRENHRKIHARQPQPRPTLQRQDRPAMEIWEMGRLGSDRLDDCVDGASGELELKEACSSGPELSHNSTGLYGVEQGKIKEPAFRRACPDPVDSRLKLLLAAAAAATVKRGMQMQLVRAINIVRSRR